MLEIYRALDKEFEVFLPQQDGIELLKVEKKLRPSASRAIFSLDVHKVVEWADAVVANINGKVPDTGTVVEAALAWQAGRVVILFQDQGELLVQGADNPMFSYLKSCDLVQEIPRLPVAINEACERRGSFKVRYALEAGEWLATKLPKDPAERNSELADLLSAPERPEFLQ